MSDQDETRFEFSLRYFGKVIVRFKEWLFDAKDEFSLTRVILLVALIAVPPLLYGTSQYAKNLRRYDGVFLKAAVKRWNEAGKPEGEALAQFGSKQRTGTVVSNRVFFINGTNYTTLFACTNLMQRREGTLFVTTNDALIFLHPSGDYKLLTDGLLPVSR